MFTEFISLKVREFFMHSTFRNSSNANIGWIGDLETIVIMWAIITMLQFGSLITKWITKMVRSSDAYIPRQTVYDLRFSFVILKTSSSLDFDSHFR